MALDPIKLGSANTTGWIFQVGSDTNTDKFGIQTCNVKALYGNGSAVHSALPAAGTSFAAVFGNSYLPSAFLLDFSEGAPGVEYLEGTVARVDFKFCRIDPLFVNVRTISVDTIINYDNNPLSNTFVITSGIPMTQVFGFPEPVVSVTYSTATAPSIGSGALQGIYALPGSYNATGFPPVPDIDVPMTIPLDAGTTVDYWDGSAFVSFTAQTDTTFIFLYHFVPNPRGWQLTKLKWDPVASRNFFAVEENWRNFYVYAGISSVSHTP